MRRRALVLAVVALALTSQAAAAGMLLEAELAGTPIRLEVGADPNRALAQVAGAGYLLRLDRGEVAELTGGRLMPAMHRPAARRRRPRWSSGARARWSPATAPPTTC